MRPRILTGSSAWAVAATQHHVFEMGFSVARDALPVSEEAARSLLFLSVFDALEFSLYHTPRRTGRTHDARAFRSQTFSFAAHAAAFSSSS